MANLVAYTLTVRPDAVETDARPIVAAGTAVFFATFVVLLFCWHWLGQHGHHDWLWTSLAGWLLGVAGWLLLGKHRREGRTV